MFFLKLFLQLVGEKQQELQVNSMQLLHYQAPLSAFLLILIIPFFEPLDAFHGVLDSWPLETVVSDNSCNLVVEYGDMIFYVA